MPTAEQALQSSRPIPGWEEEGDSAERESEQNVTEWHT